MNLVIKQTRVVEVPVTTLNVCQSIMAMTTMLDADGAVCGHAIFPTWLPQVLEIDLATGQIKNWQVPTGEQLQHIADAYADGQPAAVAPTLLTERRMAELMRETAKLKTDEPAQGVVDSHFVEIEEGIVMFGGVVPDINVAEPAQPHDDLSVHFSSKVSKWVAQIENDEVGSHEVTSGQNKFEALKNVLKKAGLTGTYEINQTSTIEDVEFYSYDDSRTKDRMSIYVSGYKVGKGYTASTSKGHRYVAECPDAALAGLISKVLKVTAPDGAIVQTTDDATVFNDKQRYSIDMSKAVAIVEPEPTSADIEDAPLSLCQPARPRYRNPDDHSQTWTGRGKPPEWLQAKLDAGDQMTDYTISDSAA